MNSISFRGKILGQEFERIRHDLETNYSSSDFFAKDARFYKIPSPHGPRYIVKVPTRAGQEVLEIFSKKDRVQFISIGHFGGVQGFAERHIFDSSLHGYGIGSAALKSFLANQVKQGKTSVLLSSLKKSTLRLLLSNGFIVDPVRSAAALRKLGVTGQDDLHAYMKKPETPEDLTWITDQKYITLKRILKKSKV